MEILLMNSMDKKKRVGFGFDLKIWVGFEKHPLLNGKFVPCNVSFFLFSFLMQRRMLLIKNIYITIPF